MASESKGSKGEAKQTMVERGRRSHEAIVEAASRLFREHGVNGVGVDGVMRAAGLTHGGFYAHFKNKDALIAEAVQHAFLDAMAMMYVDDALVGDEWLAAVNDRFLSQKHVEQPGAGCVIATLGVDVGRGPPEVQAQFARSFTALIETLDKKLENCGLDIDERRQLLLSSLARWAGALIIARALGKDHPMVAEVLRAGRSTRARSGTRSRPPQPAGEA
jgi:TetR/AcrR family transcriptional repressor of nem operon